MNSCRAQDELSPVTVAQASSVTPRWRRLPGSPLSRSESLARGGVSRISGRDSHVELINPPNYVNCYSEKAFVLESARWFVDKLRDTLVMEDSEGIPHWSGQYALVGLSGGTTPRPIYTAISQLAKSTVIDWSKVLIFLVDERYIPETHPESNTRMIRETLFSEGSFPEKNFIHPNTALSLEECRAEYEAALGSILSLSCPTLVTLGLGNDGHTASWFPPLSDEDCMRSNDAERLVHITHTDTFSVRDRLTVSMRVLGMSLSKVFFLKGEDKLQVYKSLTQSRITRVEIRRQPVLQILRTHDVSVICWPPFNKDALIKLHQRWQTNKESITIVILGASGDLAIRKTFPALFSLSCAGYLPADFHIAAYARSKMTRDDLFGKIIPHLTTLSAYFALKNNAGDEEQLANFRTKISYHQCSDYGSTTDLNAMHRHLTEVVEKPYLRPHRIFYLALPPFVFLEALRGVREHCWSNKGWNRVIIEKPFGRDSESSGQLCDQISRVVSDDQVFRMDHYLGKDMVLNLFVIRFGNVVFNAMLSRQDIKCIRITLKETGGTAGRGGYFDQYGIIRDVIQNHLLQIMTLVLMDRPASMEDHDVIYEKVKVLKATRVALLDETVVGQYCAAVDGTERGYLDDPTVDPLSITPTFATIVLHVDNDRFAGVPIIIKAGKALENQVTEVRIQFRPVSFNLFGKPLPENELVIKIQPSAAVYLKCVGKVPGLTEDVVETELDFSVGERLQVGRVNDAYERLLLDVVKGDQKNFVREDELREAWRIFTPLLHQLESQKIKPYHYPHGSNGPQESYDLIKIFGYTKNEGYVWRR